MGEISDIMDARINSDPQENRWPLEGLGLSRKPKSKKEKKLEPKQTIFSLIKEILIALIILGLILGILWAHTGYWPPVVVIESNSMMHGEDSSMGTMDTGDMVLVKSVSSKGDVKTYVDGQKSNYKTYSSYGDVIAFNRNGGSGTPVIHRAIVWIVYNASGNNNYAGLSDYGSFDVPSLGLYDVTEINIPNYELKPGNLTADLQIILMNFKSNNRKPHGGFLTKGDNNNGFDQMSNLKDSKNHPLEPVKLSWIIGKAEGEIPALGLITLFMSGKTSEPGKSAPSSSVNMLILLVTVIIVTIIILHLLFFHREKKRIRKREEEEEKKLKPFQERVLSKLSSSQETKIEDNTSAPNFQEVPKGDILQFLDKHIDVDEDSVKSSIPAQPKSSDSLVRMARNATSPQTQSVVKAQPVRTQTTTTTIQPEPAQRPQDVTSIQTDSPYRYRERPAARPVYGQQYRKPDAPPVLRAKKVTKDEMYSYLDEALEIKGDE